MKVVLNFKEHVSFIIVGRKGIKLFLFLSADKINCSINTCRIREQRDCQNIWLIPS